MTDRTRDLNLRVLTEHIDALAAHHEIAVDALVGANRHTQHLSERIAHTHGLICLLTSQAMSDADELRSTAGQALHRVSGELADKLRNSSRNYQSVDYLNGENINSGCTL